MIQEIKDISIIFTIVTLKLMIITEKHINNIRKLIKIK